MSRKEFVLDNAEIARGDILAALAALRRLGWKTMAGLDRIARHAGLLPRRTRTIVMQDQTFTVTDEQRRHLALAIADLHFRMAEEHEEIAETLRRQGDVLRHRERQRLASAFGGHAWGGSSTTRGLRTTTGLQRRTA